MRGKVEASVEEFDDAPLSGVRMRKPLPMWRMLIGEVQEQARVTCRDVPDHVRADVESAAMVGLMEAIRDFDEVEPEHFEHYVRARVLEAMSEEAAHFVPESSRNVKRSLPANDNAASRHEEARNEIASLSERWESEGGEPMFVPFSEETTYEELLTAEAAFVGSYTATALRWAIAQLEPRDQLVLRLAYKRGLALAAIAQRLRVSTPRAYQIRVDAERKLARLLRRAPAISQLSTAEARCDWDDPTEEVARVRPEQLASRRLGKR